MHRLYRNWRTVTAPSVTHINPQLANTTLCWNGLHPVFDLRFVVIIIVIIAGCFPWWSIDLAERREESWRLHGSGWHFITCHHISCLTGKWQILLHKYVEVIVFLTVLHGLAGWPAVILGLRLMVGHVCRFLTCTCNHKWDKLEKMMTRPDVHPWVEEHLCNKKMTQKTLGQPSRKFLSRPELIWRSKSPHWTIVNPKIT